MKYTDPRNAPVRFYEVMDVQGNKHQIEAQFAFDNSDEGRGLVFRRYVNSNDSHTTIVAQFANGGWLYFKETM